MSNYQHPNSEAGRVDGQTGRQAEEPKPEGGRWQKGVQEMSSTRPNLRVCLLVGLTIIVFLVLVPTAINSMELHRRVSKGLLLIRNSGEV